METSEIISLAKLRLERAKELLDEAEMLLEKEGYKSANNRAFYSMEKSVKALLALKEKDAKSHVGLLKMFHNDYVHETCVFTKEEYAKFQNAGAIRSASDYDDFYVCSKEDCIRTVEDARYYYQKASDYVAEYITSK